MWRTDWTVATGTIWSNAPLPLVSGPKTRRCFSKYRETSTTRRGSSGQRARDRCERGWRWSPVIGTGVTVPNHPGREPGAFTSGGRTTRRAVSSAGAHRHPHPGAVRGHGDAGPRHRGSRRGYRHGDHRWAVPRRARGRVSAGPPVTRLEIGFSARTGPELRAGLRQPPLASMPVEYLTPAIEDRAVEVQALLADQGHHRAPSVPDLLIAATAELAGLVVLHQDKDFELIADLTSQPLERLPD
jgi:predicted nucleic acid-binding protein